MLFRRRVALLSGLAAILIVLGAGVHFGRPVRQSHVASAKANADDDFDSDIDDLVAVSDDNDDDDVVVL